MIDKIIKTLLALMLFCIPLITHINAGDSATIQATATVINAIGFRSGSSIISAEGIVKTNPVIVRPLAGAVICQIEERGKILEQIDIRSMPGALYDPDSMYIDINIPDNISDTLVVTIIYTEN